MSEFVYLYRRPAAPPGSPQVMQDRMQRWRAWFHDLEKNGHLAVYGHPLETSGGAVVKDSKATVIDGPYAETKDIVIGFSVIEAKDLDQAVTLAAACPIYEQSGMVEVRPVMKM